MSKIFFTADTHFYHANIIRYCNRPFSNVINMNTKLIEKWNKKVKPNDTIYILGDFAFCNGELANTILQRLNGKKHLIRGNHDHFLTRKEFDKSHFEWVKDYHLLKTQHKGFKVKLALSHYPMYSWDSKYHGSIHLYGHVHDTEIEVDLGKSFNVGVDVNDFAPVSLNKIMERADEYDRNK